MDEEDAKLGIQLGCNGIVYILFEPLQDCNEKVIDFLYQLAGNPADAVLLTAFSLLHESQPGTILLYRKNMVQKHSVQILCNKYLAGCGKSFKNKSSKLKLCEYNGRELYAFIEFIPAPVSLIIAGAGNDVQPLVEIASLLEWRITVADGRQTHATAQRFPKADKVLITKPGDILSHILIDDHTVFVLMTHNYHYDILLLEQLIQKNCVYIGVLGPRKKLDKMLIALDETNTFINEDSPAPLYGPVGLDIGAETVEEMAVSIIAEIKAVLAGRPGKPLKERMCSIHSSLIFEHNE